MQPFSEDLAVSRKVEAALRALAEHDRDLEAPAAIEARVIGALRAARRERALRRWTTYAMAAAAGILMLLWFRPDRVEEKRPTPLQQTVRDKAAEPASAAVEFSSGQSAAVVQSAPPLTKRPRRSRRPTPPVLAAMQERTPELREIMTDFFPLMDAPPPMEHGVLWRVTVPASTMRSVGLPVSPERWREQVQADVLVGQEGIARAIRFVRYEQ